LLENFRTFMCEKILTPGPQLVLIRLWVNLLTTTSKLQRDIIIQGYHQCSTSDSFVSSFWCIPYNFQCDWEK